MATRSSAITRWWSSLCVLLAGASIAAAQPAPVPQFMWFEGRDLKFFETADAATLLGQRNFAMYLRLLELGECDAASNLLNRAFIAAYPQFAHAKTAERSGSYSDWRNLYVGAKFLHLRLCDLKHGIAALRSDISRSGQTAGPYQPGKPFPRPPAYKGDWLRRDVKLSIIIELANIDFLPAFTTLADYISQGELFEAGPDMEYYLLQYACQRGLDCTAYAERLTFLRNQLSEDARQYMDRKANTENLVYRVLHERETP